MSHREYPSFDQRKAGIRHLKCLFLGSVFDVEKCFVLLALTRDAMLALSAFNASDAIRFQAETQFFIPVLLLCGKENEWPFAIATGSFKVEIMRDRDSCRCLPRKVRDNRSIWNPFGLGIRTPVTVGPLFPDNGFVLCDDLFVCGRVPMQMYVTIRGIWIQSRDLRPAPVARMVDELSVLIGFVFLLHIPNIPKRDVVDYQ